MGFVAVPIVFAFAVLAAAIAWVFTPKGPNQLTIRFSLAMTITCCYLMWAITYMAQLHPLISPVKSGMRPEFIEESESL